MYCNLVEAVADVDDKLWRCCLGNVLLYQTPTVIQTHTTAPSCPAPYLYIELNIAATYLKLLAGLLDFNQKESNYKHLLRDARKLGFNEKQNVPDKPPYVVRFVTNVFTVH